MDPVGVLAAAVALAVYPGGLFLGLAAAAVASPAQRWRPRGWTPTAVAGIVGAGLAAALLPLAGAPATALPGSGGEAQTNLLAVELLLAAAVVIAVPGSWTRRCQAGP